MTAVDAQNFRDIPTPAPMRHRPVDHRGFPVPWFVTRRDKHGRWDFTKIDKERFDEAVRHGKCWVSGTGLGAFKAFCVGPMCVINRAAGDPPVRKDIAEWSVKVCPFMTHPLARHSADNSPTTDQRGLMSTANPGVVAIYITRGYNLRAGLFHMGHPESVTWWRQGRPATRKEVLEAMAQGIGKLGLMAKAEDQETGTDFAQRDLDRRVEACMALLPAEAK